SVIPFSIKVLFYRLFQLALKWSTKLLTFRTPELFSGPGSALQLCDHIAKKTDVKSLLVVTDAMLVKLGLLNPLLERLKAQGVSTTIYDGVQP
ncbi:iron-containing alcohol dehydrogenase, partial [Staphylococcus aureus]